MIYQIVGLLPAKNRRSAQTKTAPEGAASDYH